MKETGAYDTGINCRARPLGECLIERRLINRLQLSQALSAQEQFHEPIGKVMVHLGLISEEALTVALADHLDVPTCSLKDTTIDPDALKLVPRDVAQRFQIFPLYKKKNILTLLMESPQDIVAADTVRLLTGCVIRRVLGRPTEIREAIRSYYAREDTEEKDETESLPGDDLAGADAAKVDVFGTKQAYHSLGLRNLLEKLIDRKASDLYLSAGKPPYLRVKGALVAMQLPPLDGSAIQRLINATWTEREKALFASRKSCDYSFELDGLGRFRVNVCQQAGTCACAVRCISRHIPDMDHLGIPPVARRFIRETSGLVLVTGPNGSGKSTTLASMIEHVNHRRRCRVITIEDPIEYVHSGDRAIIQQREFGTDTLTFFEAVKQVARQDPDIVMVGEMRDLETIKATLTLAEAGYLVLSTLHTSDAVHAVSRIIDSFPAEQQAAVRMQLAGVLVGVIAQRLIPRADGLGRILAAEVLASNAAIQTHIRWNNLHQIRTVVETNREAGMHTMDQALLELYRKGEITNAVLCAHITDQNSLVA